MNAITSTKLAQTEKMKHNVHHSSKNSKNKLEKNPNFKIGKNKRRV
jgi:hypothetical protein